MSEKKDRNIFQRIKDRWNELEPQDKKMIFVNGLCAAIFGGIGYGISNRVADRDIAIIVDNASEEAKRAYRAGLQDGQMKAYHDILCTPDKAFKHNGMDVKKF